MNNDEVLQRRNQLADELDRKANRTGDLGKRNHNIFVVMAICAVIASLAAGFLGLLTHLSSKWIGAIALLPAGLTVASNTLKLQAKANWYYENELVFRNLLHKLKYQIPDPPSASDVGDVAEQWATFATAREKIWKDTLSLDFSNLGGK